MLDVASLVNLARCTYSLLVLLIDVLRPDSDLSSFKISRITQLRHRGRWGQRGNSASDCFRLVHPAW